MMCTGFFKAALKGNLDKKKFLKIVFVIKVFASSKHIKVKNFSTELKEKFLFHSEPFFYFSFVSAMEEFMQEIQFTEGS